MIKRNLTATSLALACLGAAGITPAFAESNIGLRGAPPPPRYEVMPAPRSGQVWVPGHWKARGSNPVWVGGVWLRERPGFRYSAPTWVQHDGRWEMRQGGWARGDRDGDGMDRPSNDAYRR